MVEFRGIPRLRILDDSLYRLYILTFSSGNLFQGRETVHEIAINVVDTLYICYYCVPFIGRTDVT